MPLDPQTVLSAATGGIWVPPRAVRIDADGYVLVRYDNDFVYDVCVHRIASARTPAELIHEVNERARAWDRPTVWWNGLSSQTAPHGLERELRDRGAQLAEELAVLALDLTAPRPDLEPPTDVELVHPHEVKHLIDKHAIHDEAFGSAPARAESFEERLEEEMRRRREGLGDSVVVYLDGEAASFGGVGYEDGVARLWGGSTRASMRGRGAYRASLDARLRAATEAGCTIALVKGRVGTSAPILRRAGFEQFGVERVYALPSTA